MVAISEGVNRLVEAAKFSRIVVEAWSPTTVAPLYLVNSPLGRVHVCFMVHAAIALFILFRKDAINFQFVMTSPRAAIVFCSVQILASFIHRIARFTAPSVFFHAISEWLVAVEH
jgi:hypothetical protein